MVAALIFPTGCSSDRAPRASRSTSPTERTTNSSPPVSTESLTPSGVPPCASTALRGVVSNAGVGAGSSYTTIAFTNIKTDPCSVTGYPNVTLTGRSGTQIGAVAGTYQPPITTAAVILEPGHQAYIVLAMGDGTGGEPCLPTATTARVTPSGQDTPILVNGSFTDCGNFFTTTFAAGASGPA
jgi:hypothetical protein